MFPTEKVFVNFAFGSSIAKAVIVVVALFGGGGEIVLRHNEVRDIMYKFASRVQFDSELEKAGLLADPADVTNSLRRRADVLAKDPRLQLGQMAQVVKVISAWRWTLIV